MRDSAAACAGHLLLAICLCMFGCAHESAPSDPGQPAQASSPLFEEISLQAGVSVRHFAGPTDEYPMPQSMGSGCALLDVNGDNRLDILIVAGEASDKVNATDKRMCSLLIQDADGRFTDRTSQAGLTVKGFGMGVAVGDIDNDNDLDILMTSFLGASLFRNDGSGQFQDITEIAAVSAARWSTAAAFVDYDRDGWLDLMVTNYVDYVPGSICEDGAGRRDYCGPLAFKGTVDRLYHNLGRVGKPGIFLDVTAECGLVTGPTKGLGLICSDLNDDGLPDLYVANDSEPNRLWIQQTDGTFRDEAEIRGCAVDVHGKPQASMGTLFADLDGDGLKDIFLTHLRGETNTLYRHAVAGIFVDHTAATGLGNPSLNYTGFGTAAVDIELDGDLDLLVANGKVMRAPLLVPEPLSSHWDEYAERNQIFLNDGAMQFTELTDLTEPFLKDVEVSRGLATGDIDNDGDIDVLISNTASRVQLFRNVAVRKGHWLTVRAIDPNLRRDSIGAKIVVNCGSRRWAAEVLPGTGYLSSHDLRVHFGIGECTEYDFIEVQWPDSQNSRERFEGGPVERQVDLVRGTGTPTAAAISEVQQ